ncbi:calcium-activated chloride channel-domain containing protein [Nitzschia inconspicua]|uniref:Calcium-activated chloride channel-domain containing protein n=1 Tax=Nitzschia inconspicua TaxID=303405 RepID=A0A9K3PUY6_9STRA|nr:calcium-activated chloride channel-domain containing protein [Nitzschia inconspicua]
MFQGVMVSNEAMQQDFPLVSDEQHRPTNLRYFLQSNGLVDTISPVHMHDKKERIFREAIKTFFQMTPPLEDIEDYYGPSIAIYFAFLSFLGGWLAILSIPGILVFVFRQLRNDTIDTDEYTPFYGLFCFIWGILLCRFWERQENLLAYKWGTMVLPQTLGNAENTFVIDNRESRQRPQFRGWVRISPVTFQEEVYYPSYKRKLKYIVSAAVTLFMLSIAFFMMILSLNLQGYIRPKHAWTRHPFHFRTLAAFADEGSIFDANSLNAYIPVVLHATCIYSLNHAYRQVATWLTEFENHKTEDAFQSSLNFKRFLFEFFDCFIALFYLAFYERDVERLRMELVAVFNVDALRRLGTEVILPFAMNRWGQETSSLDIPGGSNLNVFEPFDVYMETLIQFGYVTLFASAYPMASVAMCVSVWIEIRSGLFRFTKLYQKPLGERISSIGMWKDLLKSMVWFSCLTNCLLFGFTSDQMLQYLPSLFEQTEDGETLLAEGKGRLVVLLVFGLERVLIFTGLILSRMISDIPDSPWVNVTLSRNGTPLEPAVVNGFVIHTTSRILRQNPHQLLRQRSEAKMQERNPWGLVDECRGLNFKRTSSISDQSKSFVIPRLAFLQSHTSSQTLAMNCS